MDEQSTRQARHHHDKGGGDPISDGNTQEAQARGLVGSKPTVHLGGLLGVIALTAALAGQVHDGQGVLAVMQDPLRACGACGYFLIVGEYLAIGFKFAAKVYVALNQLRV